MRVLELKFIGLGVKLIKQKNNVLVVNSLDEILRKNQYGKKF